MQRDLHLKSWICIKLDLCKICYTHLKVLFLCCTSLKYSAQSIEIIEKGKKKVMLLRDYGWSWITKGDIFAGGGACSSVGFLISVMYKSVIFLSQLLTAFGDSYRVPGFVSFLKKNC